MKHGTTASPTPARTAVASPMIDWARVTMRPPRAGSRSHATPPGGGVPGLLAQFGITK